jgi:hypothetical protein
MVPKSFFLPACMLLNTATGRYHPIIFQPSPLPGGARIQGASRYRSTGHHTEGFDTIEAAWDSVKKDGRLRAVERVWEWDGASIPAMTEFFGDEEGAVT